MNEIQESDKRFTDEQMAAAESQIRERGKAIDSYITEYSIEILAQKVKGNEYTVPDYQREYTWEEWRKWRFIESVLMGLPIPFLFFWEDPESGKLEIIDGSQRLRTLEEFIYGDLELGEMDKLDCLEGFRFRDLSESRQRKFLNRSIRGIVLNEKADPEARFDLFDRINTGSKVANNAEVRRGALRGPFIDLVIQLAKDAVFVDLAPVSEKQLKGREREELVTRFFAYGDGLEDYADEPSAFLFAYARRMNQRFTERASLTDEYKDRFNRAMQFVKKTFPNGFRRAATGKVSPRARFESIAIGTHLALVVKPRLKVTAEAGAALVANPEFGKIVRSDSANNFAKLEGRLHFVRDRLLELSK